MFEVQKTGVIIPSRLKTEIIADPAITTDINHIIFNEPSDIRLHFVGAGPLGASEITALDLLISNHDATPAPSKDGVIDVDGDKQFRIKEASKGWHLQPHFVNLQTSCIGQTLGEFDKDLVALGWSTLEYYKLVSDVLTATTDEADRDLVVATVLEFAPPYDYEIKSGEIKVLKTPTDLCCLFPISSPDIAAPAGSKMFATGGIDLRFLQDGETEKLESQSSKFLPYKYTGLPDGWTNKIQLYIRHHPGIKVDLQFKFGILAE